MTTFSLCGIRAITGYGEAKSLRCFCSDANGKVGIAQAVLDNDSAIDPLLTDSNRACSGVYHTAATDKFIQGKGEKC